MKKLLSVLMVLCMLMPTAFANDENAERIAYEDPNGYILYYIPWDDGVQVTGSKVVTNRHLVIPKEIDGKKVVSLGCDFVGDNFTSAEICAELEEIEYDTLAFHPTIEKIIFHEGLKKINNLFAQEDTKLREIVLPESLEYLGSSFRECTNLKKVTIPDNVNYIGGAFYGCTALQEIDWDMTADYCDQSFAQSSAWRKNYGKTHDWLIINDGTYIVRYVGQGGEVTVPKAEKINNSVAIQDNNITSVTSEYGIPVDGFHGCENLKSVTVNGGEIGESAFSDCTSLSDVSIPNDTEVINEEVFKSCEALKTFKFPEKLKTISSKAFWGSGLSGDITLPESVTEVGSSAFRTCKSITSMHFPDGLEYLGKEAMYMCDNLESVNIPDGVLNDLYATFWYCPSLKNVECSQVTKSVYSATSKSPWYVNYTNNNLDADDEFFIVGDELKKYNGTDKSPVIPDSVSIIGAQAFSDANIDSVTIPSSVEEISETAFYKSTLRTITIPETVKKIGALAFGECYNLEYVNIESDCEIVAHTFENCTALKAENVTLSDKTTVAAEAFPFSLTTSATANPTTEPNATAKPTTAPTQNTAAPTQAPEGTIAVSSNGGEIAIAVETGNVSFPDAKPFVDDADRTQIPIRALSEMLNFEVSWNAEDSTATLTKGDDVITIKIGESTITKNNESIQMDTEAKVINDRTYVPLRFIAEALGYEVAWEQ